ncbi:MAG: glycosyltransferase family 4 protein, partial [Nitrospirae bacterium]|nr:glycosyltransferase family 4 protein [Nitrospirota bacterium]
MRVLFWSELFWPYIGGAENGGLELILSLRQRGHEFIVVTRQDDLTQPTVEEYEGVRIYRFPFWKAYADHNLQLLLEARKGVRKLIHEFSPDLVHLHHLGPSSLFYLETTKDHSVPLLVTLTSGNIEKVVGLKLLESILRIADWVTAKSTGILKSAHQLVPQIVHHSSVIYRGRSDLLPQRNSSPTILQRILCVGRLSTEKGFDLALSALAAIVGQFPEVEMVIVGDGTARSSLEQQAESLGLTDKVKFLGWVIPEKVPALLATAHVVMIPSRYEGVPRVAVEA